MGLPQQGDVEYMAQGRETRDRIGGLVSAAEVQPLLCMKAVIRPPTVLLQD